VFKEIFGFECRYQLRSPLFVVTALLFFTMTFLAMASEHVNVGGGTKNLNLNAPFTLIQTHFIFSIIAMFAAVAFVAAPLTRDRELKTEETLVATGVGRLPFVFGRFVGGYLFAWLSGCAAVLGSLVGTFMPWLDAQRIEPFDVGPYWFSIWVVMLPNLLVVCSLVALVAALTRSMLASYTVLVALIIAEVVVAANTDQETIARVSLLDPFGLVAFLDVTRYWTVFDRNSMVPAVSGTLLVNRLIWLAVSGAALAIVAWRFRFAPRTARLRRRDRRADVPIAFPIASAEAVAPSFGPALVTRQLWSQIRIDLRGVLTSYPFYVILLFGVVNVVSGFFGAITEFFGTPVLPVTRMMLRVVDGSYVFVALIIIVYYAGELVHRERQSGVASYVDAMPFPNGIMVAAKIVSLMTIVVLLMAVVMLTSIAVQAGHGYFDFDIGTYFVGLFIVNGWPMYLFCVLAVCIQAMASSKFVGMLILIVLFLVFQVMNSVGLEHVLYQLEVPRPLLSDMNGWGHYVEPMVTVGAYWSLWMVLAGVMAHLFMLRGAADTWRGRVAIAQRRFTRPVRATTAIVATLTVALGAWIFYNTNVLNHYETADDREALQADYEKRYKQYQNRPRPEAVAIDTQVDIYPGERRVESRGSAVLENVAAVPIDEIDLHIARLLTINRIDLPRSTEIESDPTRGFHRFALNEPLAPGARMTLGWDLSWRNPGFVNSGSSTRVVENGTFVDNREVMPMIGYDPSIELTDNNKRRKYGLPPAERLPKYDAAPPDAPNQFGLHSRTTFHTVVSTRADQIAIAPGYLKSDRIAGDRRYFEYEMDKPIWAYVAYVSARYTVANDRWNDVALQVFYHAPHDFNVARMIEASKKSLDYFTREFGPYQYRQFRILEFPAYATFAESFPNTIPYSEAIGFVANLKDPKNIDYVFYVTAHELAHQWWGHQLVGRRVQGDTLLVETLAQYSALMVMEHEYGPAQMRRFLKYELDNYLKNRGGELTEELPLKLVEEQGYIHYRKGSVAMYALKDAIGEDAVNRALRSMLARYGDRSAPFPRSGDLIDAFRAEAPADKQALITALFEKITLWDLSVTDVQVKPTDDGRYRVTMSIATKQLEADGGGRETEVPLDVWLDVGVFGAAPDSLGENDLPPPLLIEKRHFDTATSTLEFVVDERPARVGIDPYNKMIDRNPDDNLKTVLR
jgi:hypothetical protein